MAQGRTNRWWEYYFFRYFVGTIAAAAAIIVLLKFPGSRWYHPEILEIKDVGSLGIKEITGIAAVGFSFCYIASLPMLLLHATRAQLNLDPFKLKWNFWGLTLVAVVLAFVASLHFPIDVFVRRRISDSDSCILDSYIRVCTWFFALFRIYPRSSSCCIGFVGGSCILQLVYRIIAGGKALKRTRGIAAVMALSAL